MEQKDQMRHRRYDVPAYLIWVEAKPSFRGKGKKAYYTAIESAGRKEIEEPIADNDIEIETIYSTASKADIRSDVDNILKPTLDALKGVAYLDDRQVRSVTATLFDRNIGNKLAGMVEHMGKLFYTDKPHVVLISVYSDSRLAELGGPEAIIAERAKQRIQEIEHIRRNAMRDGVEPT